MAVSRRLCPVIFILWLAVSTAGCSSVPNVRETINNITKRIIASSPSERNAIFSYHVMLYYFRECDGGRYCILDGFQSRSGQRLDVVRNKRRALVRLVKGKGSIRFNTDAAGRIT